MRLRSTSWAGSKAGQDLCILGSASCLSRDFNGLNWQGDVMGLNDVPVYFSGSCTHWVSLHPEIFQYMLPLAHKRIVNQVSKDVHYDKRIETHSNAKWPGVDHVWKFEWKGGSSAMFAVQIGLNMGYDRIVLCGVPMDNSPRFTELCLVDYKHVDYAYKEGLNAWEEALPQLKGRVFSQSGNTEKLLGRFPHGT